MRVVRSGIAVAGGALALALTAGPGGAAPVIETGERCLVPAQRANGQLVAPALVVRGARFSPGGEVALRRGFREYTGPAEADGRLAARLSVIDLVASRIPRPRTVVVRARDTEGGVLSNALRVRVAPLAFAVSPARAQPDDRVLFRFSGFRPGRAIHAHYILDGRVMGRQALVRAKGPCGVAAVRRPQFPRGLARPGVWRVQFDQSGRFSPRTRPRLIANIEVYPG